MLNKLKRTDHVEMLEACRVLKKFLLEDQRVEAGQEDKERDYLKMLKTEGWQSKAEVGRQGTNNCDEGLQHKGVGK